MTKVLIVGSGPAGISAAIYARRGGQDVTVITKGDGELSKAELIENYYGFARPITGKELESHGIAGAKRLGIKFVTDEVLNISFINNGKGFRVTGKDNVYIGDALVLATGVVRKSLSIKGIKEYEGRGVSYCANCDAFFYKDKVVAVIGAEYYALHEIQALLPSVSKIILLTNGENLDLRLPPNIDIYKQKIEVIAGGKRVERVVLDDGTIIEISGVFVAVGTAGTLELARNIGVIIEDNRVVVDRNMATNIVGIYAAGNCTGGLLQIAKAVYEGAEAGLGVVRYLNEINSNKIKG